MNYGMIATGNHCNSDSLRGAPLPAVKCTDYMSISAKTYCVTGAMNGSPTVKTQCVQNQFIHPLTVSECLSAKLRDTTDNTKYTTFLSSVLGYNYPKSRTRN